MNKIKKFNEFISENYLSGVASTLINKDWDELYSDAQKEPLKSKIKEMLSEIFKDKQVMIAVADNYEWSDGSNGFINFSNLNHFITDIGYKSYADDISIIDNIDKFKKHILYAYSTSSKNDLRKGQKYADFQYDPKDEFKW